MADFTTFKDLCDGDKDLSRTVADALNRLNELKVDVLEMQHAVAQASKGRAGIAYEAMVLGVLNRTIHETWEELYELRYGRTYEEACARYRGHVDG